MIHAEMIFSTEYKWYVCRPSYRTNT